MAWIFRPLNKLDNKSKKIENNLEEAKMPKHIAIIMDGNGRWANKRGLPRIAGHKAGLEALKLIVQACVELKVQFLTVYAFSTENWRRPKEEVDFLMNLSVEYIDKELMELHKNGVKVKTIGRINDLPEKSRKKMLEAVEVTKNNNKLVLNIALNYGGRTEIIDGVNKLLEEVKNGKLDIPLTEDQFNKYLYTGNIPDPELMIRTSGEMRVSNFLLWQLAYTEFWVTDVYWPDFDKDLLIQAISDFQKRDRKFGGLKK